MWCSYIFELYFVYRIKQNYLHKAYSYLLYKALLIKNSSMSKSILKNRKLSGKPIFFVFFPFFFFFMIFSIFFPVFSKKIARANSMPEDIMPVKKSLCATTPTPQLFGETLRATIIPYIITLVPKLYYYYIHYNTDT